MRAAWVQVMEDGIILKVWQTTALQIAAHHPIEISSVDILFDQESSSIFKIGFALSQ